MKPETRTALLGLTALFGLLVVSNVIFWGSVAWIVATVLRLMGVLA